MNNLGNLTGPSAGAEREALRIYPILKPGDWVGLQANALNQVLCGTPDDPQLVVAFGYDAANNFEFITYDDPAAPSPEDVLAQAAENLASFPVPLRAISVPGGTLLNGSGEEFSAEKVLDRAFWQPVHAQLDAEELLVSAPRRRCLLVAPRHAASELLDTLVYLHNRTWQDNSYGNAPIINALFVVAYGEITAVIPLDGGAPGNEATADDDKENIT